MQQSEATPRGMTTGELAKFLQVPVRTVRWWAEAGYIEPDGRTFGGHSRFSEQRAREILERLRAEVVR